MIVQVLKADGAVEEYLHTKVLLCISNALCAAHEWDVGVAQMLAEAVTTFVYDMQKEKVASAEILAMVVTVLTETGYATAAAMLDEHHRRRNLARKRTEVVDIELRELGDAEAVRLATGQVRNWTKSMLVEEMVGTYGFDVQSARAAAGRVEEKVLAMGMPRVWSGLVRQVMMAEAAVTLRAEEYLRQA